ncbi:MAG: DUF420 domain-containing protein [Chloroflexi bacterium]|nr:DUF420 domain-containing protein [Chloroflexota bacterium]
MTDLLHQPGFLGTAANFGADVTLTLSILMAAILTVGYYLVRKGRYEGHKWVQTSGVALNVILVLWFMVLPYRDFIVGDLGGPRETIFYYATTMHATVGFFAFILGSFVVLRGHNLVPMRLRFSQYKLYMRTAYTLYMLTTVLGVWTYLTWFVVVAKPPEF